MVWPWFDHIDMVLSCSFMFFPWCDYFTEENGWLGRDFCRMKQLSDVWILCHFWLKIQPSLWFLFGGFGWFMASPLQPADWEQLKVEAKQWRALFPGAVGVPTREERLLSKQAKAWFAILQRPNAREALALGAQPCQLCGVVTHSWRESCVDRPFAPVCEECDSLHLVCDQCEGHGLTWEIGRARHEAEKPKNWLGGDRLPLGQWRVGRARSPPPHPSWARTRWRVHHPRRCHPRSDPGERCRPQQSRWIQSCGTSWWTSRRASMISWGKWGSRRVRTSGVFGRPPGSFVRKLNLPCPPRLIPRRLSRWQRPLLGPFGWLTKSWWDMLIASSVNGHHLSV